MCNCCNVTDPRYDKVRNINDCIMSHTITDADCARLCFKIENGKDVPDTSFKANCEHYTGSWPNKKRQRQS
ncbi:hypothetical protein GQ607_008220 [Colletotrichum asianum]|uniref:Uncharacterized protein n=1 Tax=Colletotrichum asianum TaxID=702518 RepID=A0A8H3WEY5_9PEZI|nr:hypothetical protein GQ607_008220 [Colletotrichum asianum]